MNIGLLAPPWIPVPPPAYGGIEAVVALLARGLAEAGHDVTVAAAPGSRVRDARLVTPLDGLPAQIGVPLDEHLHVLCAVERLAGCDVVIDHSGLLGALVTAGMQADSLHVVHGPLTRTAAMAYAAIARRGGLRLVAISHAQRRCAPHLPFAGVCHNSIDLAEAPFCDEPDEYLLFLGRISPDKGVVEAIEVARRAGRPLLIAAKCREPQEIDYFERHVAPRLGRDVRWLGEVAAGEKYGLLRRARGLVFPIAWEEPFGMVMIEAMACGTPVLATPRGSVPEVVVDALTGFIRPDPAGLAAAVGRLDEIDRAACRAHVAARFSVPAMTRAYERLATRRAFRRRVPVRLAAGRDAQPVGSRASFGTDSTPFAVASDHSPRRQAG